MANNSVKPSGGSAVFQIEGFRPPPAYLVAGTFSPITKSARGPETLGVAG